MVTHKSTIYISTRRRRYMCIYMGFWGDFSARGAYFYYIAQGAERYTYIHIYTTDNLVGITSSIYKLACAIERLRIAIC